MDEQQKKLERALRQGEGQRVEFKEARNNMPGNMFETVGGMLNSVGGDIFLGVCDDRTVPGVAENRVEHIKKDITDQANNSSKLSPTYALSPESFEFNGKTVIHIAVGNSDQIHRLNGPNGPVYERVGEADQKVTDPVRLAQIYNRKTNYHTESRVYPEFGMDALEPRLFDKARRIGQMAEKVVNKHYWDLSNEELLINTKLLATDKQTGQRGCTLAAILLLGKDGVIREVAPHNKVDLVVQRIDERRYDDRLIVRTNLLDTYDQVLEFLDRQLPKPFYMEGIQRVDLWGAVFREVVANMLMHREYTARHVAEIVVYRDRVETKNPSMHVPGSEGPMSLDGVEHASKNPLIADFFSLMGHAEERGTGLREVRRLTRNYGRTQEPQFIEGPMFRAIIPTEPHGIPNYDGAEMTRDGGESVKDRAETTRYGVETTNYRTETTNNGVVSTKNGAELTKESDETARDERARALVAELIADSKMTFWGDVKQRMAEMVLLGLRQGDLNATGTAKHFGRTRQAVLRTLNELVGMNLLERSGKARATRYTIPQQLREHLERTQAED